MGTYNTNLNDRFNHPQYVKRVAEATTLTNGDTVVYVDTTAGGVTITLPPVSVAAGIIFDITNIAGANSVTVSDAGDSGLTNITLAAGKHVSLYSTGCNWRSIAAN